MKNIQIIHKEMNKIYNVSEKIKSELESKKIKYTFGNYNNHYIKIGKKYEKQMYCIPVISVNKFYDLGVNLDGIFCEIEIRKQDLSLNIIKKLLLFYKDIEIYGYNDCLKDFYNNGDIATDVFNKIQNSTENKIKLNHHFSFKDFVKSVNFVMKMIKFLKYN